MIRICLRRERFIAVWHGGAVLPRGLDPAMAEQRVAASQTQALPEPRYCIVLAFMGFLPYSLSSQSRPPHLVTLHEPRGRARSPLRAANGRAHALAPRRRARSDAPYRPSVEGFIPGTVKLYESSGKGGVRRTQFRGSLSWN